MKIAEITITNNLLKYFPDIKERLTNKLKKEYGADEVICNIIN